MQKIKLTDLEAGMKFDKPVYIDGVNLLVPEKIEIREKDLKRLLKWGIEEVETEGQLMAEEEAAPRSNWEELLGINKGDKNWLNYEHTVEIMEKIFEASRNQQPLDKEELEEALNEIFVEINEARDNYTTIAMLQGTDSKESLARSAVNCLILAVVVGTEFKLPKHKLFQLASAALVHDIGMTKIPAAILNKSGALTPQEKAIISKHPIYSYQIIVKELGLPEEVARITFFHHERWDGKGYPKKISGNKIPLSSRIITIIDTFEALLRDRPYRNSVISYSAIRELLNHNERSFDPEILKLFIKKVGIYPKGSIVILNDGSIGQVKENHSDAPLRPSLKILIGKGGKKEKDEKVVDLIREKELFIARAVNLKELENGKQ